MWQYRAKIRNWEKTLFQYYGKSFYLWKCNEKGGTVSMKKKRKKKRANTKKTYRWTPFFREKEERETWLVLKERHGDLEIKGTGRRRFVLLTWTATMQLLGNAHEEESFVLFTYKRSILFLVLSRFCFGFVLVLIWFGNWGFMFF